MSATSIQQMADRIAGLMEERLRVRGKGLGQKLHKGARLLPPKLRPQAEMLSQAAELAQNPKLMRRIDLEKVTEAYDQCVRYLGAIDPAQRRKGTALGILASIAFSLIAVAVLVLVLLSWRGYL